MAQPHRESTSTPIAFHITFRSYGTWLHGDRRGSVDRFHNRYGTPRLPPNRQWHEYNRRSLKRPPVALSTLKREVVKEAIRETCKHRGWSLWTVNVRSNHVHTVVTAFCNPDIVLAALKANATRKLRERGLWHSEKTPWAGKGSKKRIWTEEALMEVIAYVEYEQGE